MSKNVTMQGIANKLNVSKSLVSRALSDKYGVSDAMRSSIWLAAIDMGYKFTAKQHKRISTVDSVTVVVMREDLLDSGYWVKVINAIEEQLSSKSISIFLSIVDAENGKGGELVPLSVRQLKAQGIIVLGQVPLTHVAAVSALGLPIVLVDHKFSKLKYDHILANNYDSSYEATEFLIQCGHREIGMVGSASYSFSFTERLRGFNDCLSAHAAEVVYAPQYMITASHDSRTHPFSREQFKQSITRDHHPTALFCANDITAFEVYELLKEAGLSVPEDVSVMGFDNVPKSKWVTPMLSTVNISRSELGVGAVEMLMKRIKQPTKSLESVLVGTSIVKRNSVIRR